MRNEYRLKPNRALSGRARLRPHPCNAARPPIRTVEGLGTVDGLHAIHEAFWEKHGLQCGYCTPATLMTAVELVEGNPNPSHWMIPALQGRCSPHCRRTKLRDAASTATCRGRRWAS